MQSCVRKSGHSARTWTGHNISKVPLEVPQIFQRREFCMTIGANDIDGARELLFDVRLAGRSAWAAAAVTGNQAALDLIIYDGAPGVQVRRRLIGRLRPEVWPARVHEVRS